MLLVRHISSRVRPYLASSGVTMVRMWGGTVPSLRFLKKRVRIGKNAETGKPAEKKSSIVLEHRVGATPDDKGPVSTYPHPLPVLKLEKEMMV